MEESDSASDSWSIEQGGDKVQLTEDEVEDDSFSQLECEPLNSWLGRDKAAVVRRSLVPRQKPTRQFLRSSLPVVLAEEPSRVSDDDSDVLHPVKSDDISQPEHDQRLHAHGNYSNTEWHLKDGDRGQFDAVPVARAVHTGKIPGGLGLVAAGVAAAAAAASRTTGSPRGRQHAAATGSGDDKAGMPSVTTMRQFEEEEEEVSRPSVDPGKATALGFKLPPIVPRKPAVVAKPQPTAAAVTMHAAGTAATAADVSTVGGSTNAPHREHPPVLPVKPPRPPPMAASAAAQQPSVASPKVPRSLKPMPKVPVTAGAAAEQAGGGDGWGQDDQKLGAAAAADAVHGEILVTTPPSRYRTAAEGRSTDRTREQHASDHSEAARHLLQQPELQIDVDKGNEEERLQQLRLPPHAARYNAEDSSVPSVFPSKSRAALTAAEPEPTPLYGHDAVVELSFASRAVAPKHDLPTPDRSAIASADISSHRDSGKPSRKQLVVPDHVIERSSATHDGVTDRSAGGGHVQLTQPPDKRQPSHGPFANVEPWMPQQHAHSATAGVPDPMVNDGSFLPKTFANRDRADAAVARPEVQQALVAAPAAATAAFGSSSTDNGPAQLQQQEEEQKLHTEAATQSNVLAFARNALRSSASRAHPPRAVETSGDASRSVAGIKRGVAASGSPAYNFDVTLKTMKLEADHPEARLTTESGGDGASFSAAAAAAGALRHGPVAAADSAPSAAAGTFFDTTGAADQLPQPAAAVVDQAEGAAPVVLCLDAGGSGCSGSSAGVPVKPQPRPCPPKKPALMSLPQQQQPLVGSSGNACGNDGLEATPPRLPPSSTKHGRVANGVKPASGPVPTAAAAAAERAAAAAAAAGSGPLAGPSAAFQRGVASAPTMPASSHRASADTKAVPQACSSAPMPANGATGGRVESPAELPLVNDETGSRAGVAKSTGSSASDNGEGATAVPAVLVQQQQQQPAPLVRLRRKSPPPLQQSPSRGGTDGPAAGLPLSPAKSPYSVQRRHTHAAHDVAAKGAGAPAEPVWVRMAADRAKRSSPLGDTEPVVQKAPLPLEPRAEPGAGLRSGAASPAGAVGSGGGRASGGGGGTAALPAGSRFVSMERQSAAAAVPVQAGIPQNKAGLPATTSRAGHSVAHDLAITSKDIPAVIAQRRSSREMLASAGHQNDENKPPPAVLGSPRSGSLTKDSDGHMVISNVSSSVSHPLGERRHSVDSPSSAASTSSSSSSKQTVSPRGPSSATVAAAPPSAEEWADVKMRTGRTVRSHQDKRYHSVAGGLSPSGNEVPALLGSQVTRNGASDRIGSVIRDRDDAGAGAIQEPEFMKRFRERKARLRESGISVGEDD